MGIPTNFRTLVQPRQREPKLSHEHTALSIGSCFSEHISSRLTDYRFNVVANPSGILYNPLSIHNLLERLAGGQEYTAEDVFESEGLFRSFDHHTCYAAETRDVTLTKMNRDFRLAASRIPELDTLILTFGTSFVYRLKDTGRVVANCHKLPHERFDRSLASIAEISNQIGNTLDTLKMKRPGLSIILTVSPVRHLRDNPHENQVSKAHLLCAIHTLETSRSDTYYFPSYEIMMDDLRDYRFYAEDMVHPSAMAIDYIWESFIESCVGQRSRDFIQRYTPLLAARQHRIMNSSKTSIEKFTQGQLKALTSLQTDFPMIDLDDDREYFSAL